ncbi:hypothetical protein [Massilia consociata]|uniref:Uncharacterized protein n=1 Tax=Massilia consociata TaxID=760117 RepID=A0ABV6FMS6_9BURK
MNNSISLGSQLAHEVLHNPPSAALPSNLADRWLDTALLGAERLVQADKEADPELVRIPVNLVLHLLSEELRSGTISMSDDKLFDYLGLYRIELAMEKLRRWGVVLAPAADKTTIFDSPKVKKISKKTFRRTAKR